MFRLIVYCDVSEKNKILRQELTKLKIKSADESKFSRFCSKVNFDDLSIHVFTERFRMNLAFTFAMLTFLMLTIIPLLNDNDIFNFRTFDGENTSAKD